MNSEKGGITKEQASKLGDKSSILQNLRWKPDNLVGHQKKYRVFYPFLAIRYVKERLVDVCRIGNIQFSFEKEHENFGLGRLGILIEGEWIWNSALGTERKSNLRDKTKKDKVELKSGHSDAYKSAAELFGLIIPKEIKSVMLEEREKYIYSKAGEKIGHINYNIEEIVTYINNTSRGIPLLATLWNLYPGLHDEKEAQDTFTKLKGLIVKADNE